MILPDLKDMRIQELELQLANALAPQPEGATIIPKGWKLVPMKPTKKMMQAGNDTGLFERDYPRYANDEAGSVYETMIAVAPSCPPQKSE